MTRKNWITLTDAEIAALVDQCVKGKSRAFEPIVRRYQKPVFAICLNFTRTAQDAEDAAHDTFVKAYRGLSGYDPSYKFSTWLYKIAVNHCIETGRKKKREQDYLFSQMTDPALEENPDTPAALFFKQLAKSEVRALLESLPPKYRAVLVLKYYHDLPYAEIADIVGVPKNTVASLILRGKKTLRKKMAELHPAGEVSHD